MTDFKVTDEAVQAFKHAYGQNFVDGKLIKVDERIARALEAALPVMFPQPAAWAICYEWEGTGKSEVRYVRLHRDSAEAAAYATQYAFTPGFPINVTVRPLFLLAIKEPK